MANWIINHFPEHKVYLEPFFGSVAIFFRKQPSMLETINDIDRNVTNLFRAIRDYPEKLAEKVHLTPLSREEYYSSFDADPSDEIELARVFLIRCNQAIGGKTSDRTGWRSNINPVNNQKSKEWDKLPSRIFKVANRLKSAQIENQAAVQVIERYRRNDVLIYADPPYLIETRTKRHYAHEMTPEEHEAFLKALNQHKVFAIVSGYGSDMYNDILSSWSKQAKVATTETATSKQEVLWLNPAISERHHQLNIFEVI
jgi:DNA adenine methylase